MKSGAGLVRTFAYCGAAYQRVRPYVFCRSTEESSDPGVQYNQAKRVRGGRCLLA
jgi:hypothetical protein